MDKIWKRAFFNEHKKAQQQIVILENEYGDFNPKWTEPEALTVRLGTGPRVARDAMMKNLGVYKIIYEPNMIVMYIGQGVVSQRKSAHKAIFNNEGKVIVHGGGTRTDSPVARKMFDYDPNLDNWLHQYCLIDNKQLCAAYETELIDQMSPEFNCETMAGKG